MRKILDNTLKIEEIWWSQRANRSWLNEGDRNTKYFPKKSNQRISRNYIQKKSKEKMSLNKKRKNISSKYS